MHFKIASCLFIVFLAIIQLAFINGLASPFFQPNLILLTLVFFLVLAGLEAAFWPAAAGGLFLDIFSFSFFGLHALSLVLAVLFSYFLLIKFFTNRSLYSFLTLIFSLTLFYQLFFYGLPWLLEPFRQHLILNGIFWEARLLELILNLAVTFILFYLVNFISRRFRPVFLRKEKKR